MNVKWEDLGDLVRKGFNLYVECECGHVGVVDAAKMQRWYACHLWRTSKGSLGQHLYCLRCGGIARGARLGYTASAPTVQGRFPSDERGWQRLVRGLRD